MKLKTLLMPWCANIEIHEDCDITGLANDSRSVKKGDIFFAYKGALADGRCYIESAIKNGATAIIYEPEEFDLSVALKNNVHTVPMIPMSFIFSNLGLIAARFYADPTSKLNVIGVTGTSGKTTIAYLLAQAFNLLGEKAVYIGTLGFGEPFALETLINTTPDGLFLQKFFADCVEKKVRHVCMEVSSHALFEGRVNGVHFSTAIFTNLSHEHLDFHKTMQAYKAAKAILFAKHDLKTIIINADDEASAYMQAVISAPLAKVIRYGIYSQSSLTVIADDIDCTAENLRFILKVRDFSKFSTIECSAPMRGIFNIYNLLAVISCLLSHGFSILSLQNILPKLKSAPGRFELVLDKPTVIVDFAHKPAALENVLKTIKTMNSGRLILVFGCGGDRDKTKRPIMGKLASHYADFIILTNDNPRTEDPDEIIEQIQAGIDNSKFVYKILNRRAAIKHALSLARENDVVLIAGKGHENYQEIGHKRFVFSDQKVVRNVSKTYVKHRDRV